MAHGQEIANGRVLGNTTTTTVVQPLLTCWLNTHFRYFKEYHNKIITEKVLHFSAAGVFRNTDVEMEH